MSPLSIFKILWMLYDVSKSVKDAQIGAPELLSTLPENYRALIQESSKNIFKLMILGLIGLVVIMPVSSAAYYWLKGEISRNEAMFRALILFALFPITSLAGLFWGLSFGILMAPKCFIETKLGDSWRKLVGAKTITGARVACYVMFFVGFAIFGFGFWMSSNLR